MDEQYDTGSMIDEQIEQLVRDALAEEWVRPQEEVVAEVAEELGVRDPEVLEALRTLVDRELMDNEAVHLLGDRVVDVVRHAEMVRLTHRLTAAEIDGDALDLGVDLCLIAPLAEVDGGLHRPSDAAPLHVRSRVEFMSAWGGSPRVHRRLVGPEGWLGDFAVGDLVVLHGDDGFLSIEPAPASGLPSAAEVADRLGSHIAATMRAETEGDGSPIGADELVLTGLVDGWWPASELLPPVHEIVEAAGLEVDGDMVGPPGAWEKLASLKRVVGAFMRHASHLDDTARSAMAKAIKAFDDFSADPAAVPDGSLAGALHRTHGMGAMCLHEELQRLDPSGEQLLAFVAAMPEPRGPSAAVRHMLEALARELAGDPVAAEEAVEAALAADPRWYPAADAKLGYLEARGDLRRVVNLMAALREAEDPELVRLRDRLRVLDPNVGRNAPCPCGSGRKFKQCHQGRTELPTQQRVAWLLERAANWVERFAETDLDVARMAAEEAGSNMGAGGDALAAVLADAVLFELGGLERFVAARRHLLPPDDVALVESWITGERTSLYRVTGIADDGTLTLVDVAPSAGGDTFEVARSQAFSVLSVHGLVWCRLVPVGDGWASSGVAMPLRLQQRESVLAALEQRTALPSDGGDEAERRTAVVEYLQTLFGGDATGGMLCGDGAPWVHGVEEWHVGDDREAIEASLSEAFGPGEDDPRAARDRVWNSLDAERTVLATFRLSGCLGAPICTGTTRSASDDDDRLDRDEFDAEAYSAYSARVDAGAYGYDVTVHANSIPRLQAAQAELQRLFPEATPSRSSTTPARRHFAFLRADEVMESIYDTDYFDTDDDYDDYDDYDADESAADPDEEGEPTSPAAALTALLDAAGGDVNQVLAQLPDDLRNQVLDEVGRGYEERWLDMEIPALGGHTPRQAAADPALRPDLLTLLAEFPQTDEVGQMSPARIRAALGLDPA